MHEAWASLTETQRGEQGVVPPCSPRLNRYGGIPIQHKCSENKDEAYTVVNRKILIFPDSGVFPFPDLKHRLLIFYCLLVRNPGQGHFWFPQYCTCKTILVNNS